MEVRHLVVQVILSFKILVLPFQKNAFVNQELRATAATTTHQTAETTLKMGQKTLLKRSAVPFNDIIESRNVFLILPSYAEKHSKEIKQIIASEKYKLCSNIYYNDIFSNVDINIAYSNSRNIKKLIVRTKL